MNKQTQLFEIPENEKTEKYNTCRSCTHKYKHNYGKMFYCDVRKQKNTAYGDLKIKAGNKACILYEKIEKIEKSK